METRHAADMPRAQRATSHDEPAVANGRDREDGPSVQVRARRMVPTARVVPTARAAGSSPARADESRTESPRSESARSQPKPTPSSIAPTPKIGARRGLGMMPKAARVNGLGESSTLRQSANESPVRTTTLRLVSPPMSEIDHREAAATIGDANERGDGQALGAQVDAQVDAQVGAQIIERVRAALGESRFPIAMHSRVRVRVLDRAHGHAASDRASMGPSSAISQRVEVVAPSAVVAGVLQRRFAEVFTQAAATTLGVPASAIAMSFVVEGASSSHSVGRAEVSLDAGTSDAPSERQGLASEHAASASGAHARRAHRHVVNERHRLESFVVGESNRLVYNAAVQMAEGAGGGGAGSAYRHLFIHGPCGVGKTHLLQGIAIRYKERHPGANVRVTTGEQFMNEFVAAIRGGGSGASGGGGGGSASIVERFRRQYRRADLLCIDDVQFLASKQATQAELLHTFDEIERGGALVVLVSDQAPRQLQRFSPALVSRFMAGMVAGLGAPDAALRDRMVRVFAQQRGLVLDDGAVATLVERSAALPGSAPITVRELEGMLTKVEALSRLLPGSTLNASEATGTGSGASPRINATLVTRALGFTPLEDQSEGSEAPQSSGAKSTGLSVSHGIALAGSSSARALRPVRVDEIIRHTCSALSVEERELSGKTRHVRVVLARAIITHLARALTTMSFPEIARAIGRPNHSTVITAFQRLHKQLVVDELVQLPGLSEARPLSALIRQLAHAIQSQAARRA